MIGLFYFLRARFSLFSSTSKRRARFSLFSSTSKSKSSAESEPTVALPRRRNRCSRRRKCRSNYREHKGSHSTRSYSIPHILRIRAVRFDYTWHRCSERSTDTDTSVFHHIPKWHATSRLRLSACHSDGDGYRQCRRSRSMHCRPTNIPDTQCQSNLRIPRSVAALSEHKCHR